MALGGRKQRHLADESAADVQQLMDLVTRQERELRAIKAKLAQLVDRNADDAAKPLAAFRESSGAAAGEAGRRALLRSAGAGAVALAGAGLLATRPQRAEAATGGTFTLGAANDAGATTSLTPSSGTSPDILLDIDNSASTSSSATAAGVQAIGPSQTNGLVGTSNGQKGYGVLGQTDQGYGVVGSSGSGIDINAAGTGRLVQRVQSFAGAPPSGSGSYSVGEQIRDVNGALFICTASGSPGTWRKVTTVYPGFVGGAVNLLSSPIRILDTRPGQGAPLNNSGQPLQVGQVFTVQVTGTSVGGVSVPTGALAVIGNLTVTDTAGLGDLRLYPANLSTPLVSSVNFSQGWTIANGVTMSLSPVGSANAGAFNIEVDGASTDVIFDVTGFVA